MIHTVLQVIAKDLDAFLRGRFGGREEVVILSGLMNNLDGSFAVSTENRVVCSLLNIEQERLNANAPMGTRVLTNPPFNLNLYVLFSAFYKPDNYVDALKALSLTIGFFQGKQVFTPANTPGLDPAVEKLTVELVNVDMKDLGNLWTAVGAKHLPGILFKIRMLAISTDVVMEEITPITGLDTPLRPQ